LGRWDLLWAHSQGLLVILDNHTSDAIWCCSISDGNGLWYTEQWPEEAWLAGWSLMARRYANSSTVIGAGLRNEPRPVMFPGQSGSWGPQLHQSVSQPAASLPASSRCLTQPSTVIQLGNH